MRPNFTPQQNAILDQDRAGMRDLLTTMNSTVLEMIEYTKGDTNKVFVALASQLFTVIEAEPVKSAALLSELLIRFAQDSSDGHQKA